MSARIYESTLGVTGGGVRPASITERRPHRASAASGDHYNGTTIGRGQSLLSHRRGWTGGVIVSRVDSGLYWYAEQWTVISDVGGLWE